MQQRDDFSVRLEQVIDQRVNLVQRQFGGCVRVKHRRVVNMLFFARQDGLDHQALYVDVGAL